MRAVPHCFALVTSLTPPPIVNADGTAADGTTQPPIQRTGWSGDGAPAPGGLKQFQVGAIMQHYTKSLSRIAGTDFVLPSDEQLSRIEDFLRNIGRSHDISLASVSLSDPGAEAGRLKFLGARCNGCHANAGANNGAGVNRNFDTGVERARPAGLAGLPHDGGFGAAAAGAPFNHDADGDGVLDSYGNGTFNTPPLIEAADTAPFFHNNAAETIEDAVRFYTSDAFKFSAAGNGNAIALTEQEIANIGKLLRVLNASLNCQLAARRLNAVLATLTQYRSRFKGVQDGLLDAAQVEVRDALTELSQASISPDVQTHLQAADLAISAALSNAAFNQRSDRASTALNELLAADSGLGTGMQYDVGPGTLMF
jgi:hypothetical protein